MGFLRALPVSLAVFALACAAVASAVEEPVAPRRLAEAAASASAAVPLPSQDDGTDALPTPGVGCGPAFQPVTGRYFGEPETCLDYISYEEFRAGMDALDAAHPDLMEIKVIGQSYGWENTLTGSHDVSDVMLIEVTNEKSPIPYDEKPKILFMLSIHGNEKGGREGGFRVIEDFVTGQGMAAQYPELAEMMDWVVMLFLFPNPDGWRHEELEYRPNNAGYVQVGPPGGPGIETQNFVRVNGNGVDLNREAPTVGWFDAERYTPVSEPESIAYLNYLKNNVTNIVLATDIHGMLNPADFDVATPDFQDPSSYEYDASGHFILTMLSAGRLSPLEMRISTMLSQTIMERINENEKFATFYTQYPSIAGQWGGEANQWGTVWDTIGYTDSGFSSDWFLQDIGLDAPGVDFEMAYNHIVFDNYYPGAGQAMNVLHVETVRQIVRSFLEQAATGPVLTYDVNGVATGYVINPKVVTNLDDEKKIGGWAAENPNDDIFDINHRVFEATPNDYFVDLAAYVSDKGEPARFDAVPGDRIDAALLANYEAFVVGGSAVDALTPEAKAALAEWTRAGGNLVLTDSALTLLADPAFALVGAKDVGEAKLYAGYTNFYDRSHNLVSEVRGLARQTYEPVPMGFAIRPSNSAPNWYLSEGAVTKLKGEAVGWVPLGQGAEGINYGSVAVGEGNVRFLGSLLPDPSEEFYHPYGLESYATTYTGNQLFLNMLDWKAKSEAPPLSVEQIIQYTNQATQSAEPPVGTSADTKADTPGLGVVAVVLVGLALVALRRRKA